MKQVVELISVLETPHRDQYLIKQNTDTSRPPKSAPSPWLFAASSLPISLHASLARRVDQLDSEALLDLLLLEGMGVTQGTDEIF